MLGAGLGHSKPCPYQPGSPRLSPPQASAVEFPLLVHETQRVSSDTQRSQWAAVGGTGLPTLHKCYGQLNILWTL